MLFRSNKPISEFIETFENEWAALEQLATSISTTSSGASSYRRRFNAILSCDEVKRDILLSSLIPHMENIIDNISTKADMTFAEAKSRLMNMPSHQKSYDAALVVTSKKAWKKWYGDKQNKNTSRDKNSSRNNICTYCKKDNFTPCEGDTWKTCCRLKTDQKKKDKKKQEDIKNEKKADSTESANITDAVSTAMDITSDTDTKVSTNISTDSQESTNITTNSGFNVSTKRRRST